MRHSITTAAATLSLVATHLGAQMPSTSLFIEGRGGAVAPTFEIADVAKTGGSFGATLGLNLNDKWSLMAEFDNGMHKDKNTGLVDINTLHYMAKIGYSLTGTRSTGWEASVNLGAGIVTFDVEGAPEANSYVAINAGAKLLYGFTPSLAFVLSPQGDIAFSKEDEITTTNAWVWPFTAGLRVRF
jgi:hypothetical protein